MSVITSTNPTHTFLHKSKQSNPKSAHSTHHIITIVQSLHNKTIYQPRYSSTPTMTLSKYDKTSTVFSQSFSPIISHWFTVFKCMKTIITPRKKTTRSSLILNSNSIKSSMKKPKEFNRKSSSEHRSFKLTFNKEFSNSRKPLLK